MKRVLLGTLLFVAATVPSAHAISLEEAKKKGIVGETASGYLEEVEPSAEAKELVSSVNGKRREAYKSIAQKNGSSVDVVEKIGGKKAIEQAPEGTFVKLPSSKWRKK